MQNYYENKFLTSWKDKDGNVLIENKFGRVELPLYHFKDNQQISNNVVGISMSGGADSTMLCYLFAKFMPHIIIQPISGFDLGVPNDSNKLPKIIEYIRNEFKGAQINWPLSTVFSNDSFEAVKHEYIRQLKHIALDYGLCDMILAAITRGAPIEVQEKFNTYDNMARGHGQNIKRIKGYNQYGDEVLYDLYDEVQDGGPFSEVDKRFVIQCYKDFDKKDLLNMTASCVVFDGCDDKGKSCWWCCERDWAIKEVYNA